MPPFGDSIIILAHLSIWVVCLVILFSSVIKKFRKRPLGLAHRLFAAASLGILTLYLISTLAKGSRDYNPLVDVENIVGSYFNGEKELVLKQDGTYTSMNLPQVSSGSWINHDWNLTLEGSRLLQSRIITRNGKLCLLPYYSGVDGPDGILLKKESEPVN